MAAYWMARCGIKTRIVDKRGHKVYNGHADGLRPRTEEIFDSMGGDLQQRIEAEGYVFESFRTWVRKEDALAHETTVCIFFHQSCCRRYIFSTNSQS
jgi:2-polyprenyl-6-methoxyphenol hydroxylase-like FAD-dependent oxidoreductase